MICKIINQADRYISKWIINQPNVKEESLTDWHLYYISSKSKKVVSIQFSRQYEGRLYGADWDWWILTKRGCIKYRVQAKRLKPNKNHYNEIAKKNKNGYQNDILLKSSISNNFYPLYIFYGHSEFIRTTTNFQNTYSIHVSPATAIQELVSNNSKHRITQKEILKISNPLILMFCNSNQNTPFDDYPEFNFYSLFQKKIIKSNSYELLPPTLGFEQDIPDIVIRLFEESKNANARIKLLQEYQKTYKGSNSVLITNLL